MPSKHPPASPQNASKFRHIFGQNGSKQDSYEWGTSRCCALAVNPKFLAASLEGPSNGCILVSRVQDFGRFSQTNRLIEHKGLVVDLKWNPFNDNVLASASADNTVKIWHIKNDGSGHVIRVLTAHVRKVEQIEWHQTVDDLLLTMGGDSKITLWDVAGDKLIFEIDDYLASCIAFSPNSSLFAATTKNKHRVTIFDARTGDAKKSTDLPHEGNASPKVLFPSQNRIITFGSTKANRRQFAIFSLNSMNSPLCLVDIDGSSGLLLPVFDNDLSILFVTGKGDTVIRFYELLDQPPWSIYLNETCQHLPHTALSYLPKRALNFSICEIFRFYRLHPEHSSVTPLSIIAPKRSESGAHLWSECTFHPDLFPKSRAPTPALSLAEWRAGLDLSPVLIQLRLGMPVVTSKPVHLKNRGGELVTADVNNDRKFRFLSQETKADYRVVSEREDCDDIMKLEQVKNKLANSQNNSFSSNERGGSEEELDITTASQISLDKSKDNRSLDDLQKETTISKENDPPILQKLSLGSNRSIASAPADNFDANEESIQGETRERGQSAPLAELEDSSSPDEPTSQAISENEKKTIQREYSSPPDLSIATDQVFEENQDENSSERVEMAIGCCSSTEDQLEIDEDKEATPKADEINQKEEIIEDPKIPIETTNQQSSTHLMPNAHLHISSSARELRSASPKNQRGSSPCQSESGNPVSRPGIISPRIPSSTTQSARIRSSNPGYETPKWAQNLGNQPKFAHRCIDLDATLEDKNDDGNGNMNSTTGSLPQLALSGEGGGHHNILESTIIMLERSLRKSDARNSQLERIVQLQQQDIESLRFEIEWKDERIAYLQTELTRLETLLPPEIELEEESLPHE